MFFSFITRAALLSFSFIVFSHFIAGQTPSRDLFNIVFENNFNDNQTGNYLISDYQEDWINPRGAGRLSETDILNDNNSFYGKYMRGYFPIGTVGTATGGWTWNAPLPKAVTELYFSYDVRFKPDFKWVMGGKLPGVTGGHVSSGTIPDYDDGFSVRLMWKGGGSLVFYVYHHDQEIIYGSSYDWNNFEFTTGKWYNLTFRVVLNTIENNAGLKNGIIEGFVDGKLVCQIKNMRFRNLESIKIDNMYICSFFGGGSAEWSSARDEWIDTDNYLVYSYSDKIQTVPRGLQTSSFSKTLLHPYRTISDTEWKNSFKSTQTTKTSISLAWSDYPVPAVYTLERKEGESTSFTSIATIPYGTKTYTDNNLKAGINYTYRLKAANSVVEKTISTMDPLFPYAPSSVTISGQTKSTVSLKWTDNSNNETGFRIQRSISSTEGFTDVASIPGNTTTYTDAALQPGTNYYYRISAFNTDGSSEFTSVIQAITTPLQIPLSPSGLIASAIDYTEASILWKDNADNELGFELERSGPDNNTIKNIITIPANSVSFTDTGLVMNGAYLYRIRSKNDDGESAWSNQIEVVTPIMYPPATPTKLRSTKYTDRSVSVTWKDNSNNEEGFIIHRALATDSLTSVSFRIGANDTSFTDNSLESSTTYQYTVIAVNRGGYSSLSNKNVATTLSIAELKRTKDGLIAYYNFGYNPDYIVYDQSGYEEPVNLRVLDRSAVKWNENLTMNVISNTALVSMTAATKIIQAIKSTDELTFECWIKPIQPDFTEGSRIVSLSNDDEEIGFLIDQSYTKGHEDQSLNYSARLQTESTLPSGFPEYTSNQSQSYINLQHVVYSRSHDGCESMYMNGIKSTTGFRPSTLSSWKNDFYLRLGNESDMNHSWKGSYYSVALYNKALSPNEVLTNFNAGPKDSIQDSDIDYTVEVFPNPVCDEAYLTISPQNISDIVPPTLIRITDIYGKLLHQETIFNPNAECTCKLDFSSFTPGMFCLQVISGKRQKTKKILVQK